MASKLVSCPQCGTGVKWSTANRFRPFCSERCKMIDLGAWATERYRVPLEETDPQDSVPEADITPRTN